MGGDGVPSFQTSQIQISKNTERDPAYPANPEKMLPTFEAFNFVRVRSVEKDFWALSWLLFQPAQVAYC